MVYAQTFCKPLAGEYQITSPFGARAADTHLGVDWDCPEGTNVYAMNNGRVVKVTTEEERGNLLEIELNNLPIKIRFFHLSEILVVEGEYVRIGQIVAKSGRSGLTTVAHLHLTVESTNTEQPEFFDPMIVLNNGKWCEPATFGKAENKNINETWEEAVSCLTENFCLWTHPLITDDLREAVLSRKDLEYLFERILWLKNDLEISRQVWESKLKVNDRYTNDESQVN